MALGPDEAESRRKKTMAIARFAGTPRVPKAAKNDGFEALGGQVGQEHVIAAHLDREGKAFSTPSEPKRYHKKTNLEDFVAPVFGSHLECTFEGFQTPNGSQNVTQNGALADMADLAQV